MIHPIRTLVVWSPRATGLAFVGLLALLSADVFGEEAGFPAVLLALALHLVPALVLLAFVLAAWRREWIGAIGFAAWAVLWLAAAPDGSPLLTVALVAGVPLVIAVLFMVAWRERSGARPGAVRG